jgi:hypothetical protein
MKPQLGRSVRNERSQGQVPRRNGIAADENFMLQRGKASCDPPHRNIFSACPSWAFPPYDWAAPLGRGSFLFAMGTEVQIRTEGCPMSRFLERFETVADSIAIVTLLAGLPTAVGAIIMASF